MSQVNPISQDDQTVVTRSPVERLIEDERMGAETPAQSPTADGIPATEQHIFRTKQPQTVPYRMEYEGELYDVAFHFAAFQEEWLKEYDSRRNIRLTKPDEGETNQRGAVATDSDVIEAAAWLFDRMATGVEGFGEEGEATPEDWKDSLTKDEKADIIQSTVLACQIHQTPILVANKRLPWKRKSATSAEITLRSLWGGYEIETKHYLKPPTSDITQEYNQLKRRGILTQGERLNHGERHVPARWARFGDFYNLLKESVTNYEDGKVPLHHKTEVIIHHLDKENEAVTKNSKGSSPS